MPPRPISSTSSYGPIRVPAGERREYRIAERTPSAKGSVSVSREQRFDLVAQRGVASAGLP